jgi:hypothetical protein
MPLNELLSQAATVSKDSSTHNWYAAAVHEPDSART